MKIKHFILVSLLLAILTLGAVSAADDADLMAASDDAGEAVDAPADDVDVLADDDYGVGEEEEYDPVPVTVRYPDVGGGTDNVSIVCGDAEKNFMVKSNDATNIVNCTLFIDEALRYDGTINEVYTFNVSQLSYGYHTWSLSYTAYYYHDDGDSREMIIEDYGYSTGSFTLDYYALELPKSVVFYGLDEIVTYLVKDAAGYVTVYFDNTLISNRTVKADDDDDCYVYYISLDDLDYGTHTYEVTYSGDGKYAPFTKSGSFERTYIFNADLDSQVVYGDELSGTIEIASGTSGNVTITLNGKSYAISVAPDDDYDSGEYKFTLDNFAMGENTVVFSFMDAKHPKKTFNRTVWAYAHIVTPEYAVAWGENATISLVLPEDAAGNLYVYIYGENSEIITVFNQTLQNGRARYDFDTSQLRFVSYGVEYTGNDYYVDSHQYESFAIVPKVTVPAKIWAQERKDIVVELPQGTSGHLEVYITPIYDSEAKTALYNGTVTQSRMVFSTSEIAADDYYLYVTFVNESCQETTSGGYGFSITEWEPTFEIGASTSEEPIVKYSGNRYLFEEINIPSDANGILSVYIDGKFFENITVSADEYDVCDVSGFAVGKHTWELRYSGDAYYKPVSARGTFAVTYFDISESASPDDSITIYFSEDSEGYVSVSFDGKAYDLQYVKNGRVNIPLDKLSAGDHSYVIKYSGDGNDTAETVTGYIYVENRFWADVDEYGPYPYGLFEAEIYLPTNVNGYAYVSVDGKAAKSVKITDGFGVFADSDLSVGDHDIEISYGSYDEIYYWFTIGERCVIQSTVSSSMEYGQDETISIVTPKTVTGNLIINIDGVDTVVPLSNGRASYSLKELAAGYHNVTARFEGSTSVNAISLGDLDEDNHRYFPVYPKVTYPEDVYAGDNMTFTIELQNDVTGHFTYVVRKWVGADIYGDAHYEDVSSVDVPITGGKATFLLTNVTSLDDEFVEVLAYVGSENIPEKVLIYHVLMQMDIPQDIQAGKDSNVTISLPEDANGTITVVIDDKDNFTVPVINGKATIPLDLSDGKHSVDFKYDGNYGVISINKEITASKLPVDAAIANVNFKKTTTGFDIVLSANATGKLLVMVDNLVFEKELSDGRVSISANDLAYGKRNVVVSYAGDANYSAFKKDLSISVPYPKITSKVASVVCSFGSYSVTVIGIDGKAAGGVSVVFKINGKKIGTAKTNSKGVASIKINMAPKKYKVTAEALKVKLTKTVSVKHALTLKSVKVKRSAKKLVLTATLKNGKKAVKGKKITFKFNGKKLTAKTNKKGVAKVTVKKNILKKLKAGKKVKYQAAYLKDIVKKSVKVKK